MSISDTAAGTVADCYSENDPKRYEAEYRARALQDAAAYADNVAQMMADGDVRMQPGPEALRTLAGRLRVMS